MKYIAQILASLVYTSLFTGIMYLVITVPLAFILSLPWWGILLFIFIGGGILEAIVTTLGSFGTMPYVWIVKKNIIATIIAIVLVLVNVGMNLFRLWGALWGNGTWAIIFGIVVTVILLQFVYAVIMGIIMAYQNNFDD